MKPFFVILACFLVSSGALRAERVSEVFADAKAAYDADNLEAAIQKYEGLVEEGVLSHALFFNLGNAYFRSGAWGKAIANYKQAIYLNPRDPDATANLGFAFESAGVAAPEIGILARANRLLTPGRWAGLATVGYWGGLLFLGAWVWRGRRNPVLVRIAVVLLVLLAVSLNGLLHWKGMHSSPEVVVTRAGQQALFAPLDGSTAFFAVPEGSVLRLTDEDAGWVKVARGKQAGWIPRSACDILRL